MNVLILLLYIILPLTIMLGVFYLFRFYKERKLDRPTTGKFTDIRAEEVRD